MPFVKAKRQPNLNRDDDVHCDAKPTAEMGDQIFQSEFSDDNDNEVITPWPGTFEQLQQTLSKKIAEINRQTEQMENRREQMFLHDEARCRHQQEVEAEEVKAGSLHARIIDLRQPPMRHRSEFEMLLVEQCDRLKRLEHLQHQRDHASHCYCRENASFNRQMVERQRKFAELQQLARQHQRLVTKIKTDPQLRPFKEQLEKSCEKWDVVTWPRPLRPPYIVANAIARPIDHQPDGRRVYLIRHAERVQDIFPNWINECFIGEKLDYVVGDGNMPRNIPERRNHPSDYLHDSPVTEMGRQMATIVGSSLQLHDRERAFFIVSSPALYCVQTAFAIKEGASLEDSSIAVEPALFEDFHLEVNNGTTVAPNFLNAADYKSLGEDFNSISSDYRQLMTLQALKAQISKNETPQQRFSRLTLAVAEAVKQAPANASVVIVAHPATLEAVDSFLGPRMPLPDTSTAKDLLGLQYPYLSVVGFHEMNGRWKRIVKPLPPFTQRSLTNATNVLNNNGQQ